jgi:hypothetical protein
MKPMKKVRRTHATLCAVALVFVGMAVVTTSASAQAAPTCGSVISSNTTLQADVGPCNNSDGLILRGSNFTLDLNGHRVFSTSPLPRNRGTDQDGFFIPADFVGIKLLDATNVTVRNGTVERFAAGVSIENGASNTVESLTTQFNQGPCIGEDFSTFAIGSYGDGIVIFGSPNNRLLNNRIRNNGPFSGIAVVANNIFITRAVPPFPSGTIIRGNQILDNNICFADIGIRLEGPGASNSQVTNNFVRNSFQEGIVVHPVNVIDFQPLFQNPPACQNRGFPNPNLPLCPIQDPLNPTNDNNLIANNVVSNNGYGGAQVNAGPNLPNSPSLQVATGINLLSFCGYGARSTGVGNVIQNNQVTNNAGDGITVGGCPLGQNPAQGTFPGYTNSRIVGNYSVFNNGRNCGTLPAQPGCGSRPTTPRFDLRDSTHQIICPSTNAGIQARCASMGFAPPPATGPFVGTPVIQAGGTPCDNNFWFGNVYRTAFPACTTNGGRQVTSAASAASGTSGTAAAGTAAQSATLAAPSDATEGAFPVRRPKGR